MKKLKKIISIIVLILLLPVLIVNSVILINSYTKPDEIPSFMGWKPFIVLSGSMETEIKTGDIVVVKEVPIEEIKLNDVIAFKEDGIVITHRIVEIKDENGLRKYITKGDNNNVQDSGFVLKEQIEGVYQFRIEGLGNLAMFIQTPIGMLVCLSIPLGILLLIQMSDNKKIQKEQREKYRKEKDLEKEIEMLRKQNEELKNKKS